VVNLSTRDLTAKEFADIFGVHHRTVLTWIKAGPLNGIFAYRLPGKHEWRIPQSEVDRLKTNGAPSSTSN